MSKPIALSISIVVYRPDTKLLTQSLRSLRESVEYACSRLGAVAEFTVVDNSCDPSQPVLIQNVMEEALAGVQSRLMVSAANSGYGAGNNLAIKEVESDFHIVANPDIFPSLDAVEKACIYMGDNHEVVMVTPAVTGEDGVPHYLCKRNPTLLLMFLRGFAPTFIKNLFKSYLARFEMRDLDYAGEIDNVPYPTGCFMFFRTSALKSIKGFDEDFFMYLEDADIGRRIGTLGKVRFVPSVKIVHRWARGSHRSWRLRWITIQSAFIYWRKWGGIFRASN